MTSELYKTANARTSFICESLLGYTAQDGTEYNKIAMVLVLRDANNKAEQTVKYFLDVPTVKVLMTDLFHNELRDEYSGFKKHGGKQRALSIKTQDADYRISIMNSNGDADKQSLYFDITVWQARELAVSVLDHVRNYELAQVLPEQLTRAGIISVLNNEYKATSEKLDWCSFALGFVNGVLATVNNLSGGQHDF